MENIDKNVPKDNQSIIYAGFWVRVLGTVIDAFILGLMASTLEHMVDKYSNAFPFFMLAIFAAYEIYFNAHFRGTPGKRILGLELLGLDFKPVGYGRAALRFVLKFFLWIFLTSPIYVMALFSHISEFVGILGIILPAAAILMMLFNARRQVLYDYLAKTIVVDRAESDAVSVSKAHTDEKKFQTTPRRWTPLKVFRTFGILAVVAVGAFSLYYFGMYMFVFGSLALHKQRAYDNSFHMHYTTRDHNDTRIRFYHKELDRYSKEFIEAEGMYDIFAADTKRDLALNCIEATLKDHNVSDWIDMGSNFRKNARNKYADTEARIKKAKANEDWMGRHFYDYDLNDVNHIERKIANIWEPEKNAKTCDALMPIEEMYRMFIEKYIPNRFEVLTRDRNEYDSAPSHGTLDKSFYARKVKKEKNWLNLLQKKHPGVLQRWKKLKKDMEKKRKEKEKQKKVQERYALQQSIFSALSSDKSLPYIPSGMDISRMQNDQGENPLMFAVKKRLTSYFTFDTLAEHTHDFSIEDKNGKTIRDYLGAARDGGWKYADKVYLCLLGYEAKKLGGDIPSWSINNSHVAFDLVHLSCEKLHYPKSYECRDIDKIRSKEPPIFTAMRQGDHTKLRKLLEHGANPNERNPFGTHSLFSAIGYRDAEVVKLLLDHGADMYAMDENGFYSAWTRAVDTGDRNLKIIQLFLDHGVDVNFQHNKSETALTIAAKGCRNFETVSLLMQHGADPDIEDTYGSTTRKGLFRYCRDKKALKKMLELIK